MQRFEWPGYEVQLLGELQRQQNSAQFCDTLLQTEGISVPTHSCVLAALSPYFFQRLSSSPSPPSGQKHQLQLQAVTAQTLLKLVGLLYSGELEVKGSKEQSDVLAAARQLGITDLVEGCQDGGMKRGEPLDRRESTRRENGVHTREGRERLKMQDAQVQAEMVGMKRCVSIGTQTVNASDVSVGSCGQTTPPIPESVSPGASFSVSLPPQNPTFDKQLFLTPCPTIPSDGESTLGQSSGGVSKPTSSSALSSDTVSFPVLLSDDPSSPRSHRENISQESPKSGNDTWVLTNGRANNETLDSAGNAKQPRLVSRGETLEEDNGNSTGKRHSRARAGMKSLAKMKQMEMMETTQISIKVKLRRRTKGEGWEVVSMQDTDEALSVLTSVKQGCSNQKAPQTVCRDAPFPPSSVHSVQKPETQNRQPVVSTSPKTPSSDPDQSDEPESAAPPPPQGCVETDEQIERLLEDIMMGLNILPNMDDNCKKSQLNHDGAPAFCHVPGTEGGVEQNHMHAGVGAAGCVFYQDLGTRSTHSSAETGILCCFGAQSQPSCPGLPAAQPDLLIPQHRSKFESSVGSTGQSEAMSFQDVLSSKSENSLGLVPTPKESAVPLPSLQQPSSQEDPTVLDFLPLLRGSEMHSEQTLSSSCIDDLRLPGRLSPLEPRTSAAPDEPLPNSSANPEGEPQRQPLLHRRPWLTETPGSLQFPLRAIAADKSASPPQDPNDSVHSSHDFEKEKETEKETELSAELKSEPNKMKESLKCTQHDATEDAEAPKRRRRRCRGLASKKSEVSDGTKTFSFVSLSSKKMLVKERETTSTPSNKFCTRLRKLKEAPAVSEKTRGPEALSAGQTRIRTRGFVKKSQENAGNTIPEMSRVLIPVIHRAVVVDEQGRSLPRRKRGRPCKMKLEESLSGNLPIITENKSHDEAGEQQADKDAPQVEKDEKTKKRGRKRRMNPTEAAAVPQKKSTSDECSVKAEGDDKVKKVDAPERSWMVTLKEFQKLIKRQHSKTKKSKESQDVCQPVREEKAKGGDTLDGSANEADMDIKDQVPLNVSVDENHNQLSNAAAAQRSRTHHDDTNGSTGLFGHPVSSSGVLEEEQPLKNPDEGTFCSSGGSDATQFASSDEDAPHSDSRVPPQNKTANSSPDIPKKLGPPASLADEISVSSDGSQEEEEEEEVDVLLYSPEKGPLNTGCEDGPSNMVLISDEEEEEDVNEIDVTGDEGE